jgi:hypothetical protein
MMKLEKNTNLKEKTQIVNSIKYVVSDNAKIDAQYSDLIIRVVDKFLIS